MEGQPEGVMARFGYFEHGKLKLNARGDNIRSGRLHKTNIRARRCVIPALGFYEFVDEGGGRPKCYMIERKDGQAMSIAGVWQEADHKGDTRPAFLLVTDDPNDFIRPYHDRMPLVLADDQFMRWLDLSQSVMPDESLLVPLDELTARPMNTAANSSKVKDLDAIDPQADRVRAMLDGTASA